ncbi:hypothetical protein H310_12035 [Aphanomyces invadans]|uniref:Uncharacterized protein n=1 Tax=Aphanomyces invadans TaxID=157072 RepID=A0A024TLD5_9STRA|nr:hypothetical protein H310_12035 [Aphanomyces invadans]ETV94406.1 hypothetical protein H310_12035 [Aphanomyces invadans]|eukprot:XP_008877168.1 hypothetical protein H310_12035 [Aphanomyces invadans]
MNPSKNGSMEKLGRGISLRSSPHRDVVVDATQEPPS